MQASYTDLIDFVAVKKIFVIPVYQRNYDWNERHCARLFEDIDQIVKSSEEHFIGAIIYQKLGNKYIIIDGQQRLTSFLLLAKAIDAEEYFFDLQPSEYDRPVFKKIMGGGEFTEQEKISRLYQNYNFFKSKINSFNAQSIFEALKKLKIVALELGAENPQQIFESLNSTGKDLTETELIRNFLLMDLDFVAQENLYKNYWLKIELLLKTSETLETFMVQYLVASRKSITDMQSGKHIHISKNNLYDTFKKYFKENYSGDKPAQAEKFLADLHHNAEFYSHLLFDANTNFSELSVLDKKFYELIFLVKSANAPIILMYLNNCHERGDFDEANFIEMVEALISLMFRAKVCKLTGIDSGQAAGNIIYRFAQCESHDADAFWRAITAGNGKYTFPSNEDFKQALMSTELNLSLKDTCKYLLYVLDGATDFKKYFDMYVEPVIPKTLTAAWKNYLRDKKDLQAEDYVHSLGNLVLIESDKNKKAAFNDKRLIYNKSRFNLTQEVSKVSDWTSRQIRRRAEVLADKALAIWKLPAEYDTSTKEGVGIFTLDSDFNRFTGTKPAIISISNVEKETTNWRDFLREVMFQLYSLDRDIFKQAVNSANRNNLFSADVKKFETPFQMDNDYYMEVHFRASDCLKIIKSIVENFDRISGMNFKDEIWFTLKD